MHIRPIFFRDQLLRYRLDMVFRSLKEYTTHQHAFLAFLMEDARKESQFIEKEVSRNEFTFEDLKKFSYKEELARYQKNCPILVACIVGSISRSKVNPLTAFDRNAFLLTKNSNKI